MKRRLPDRPLGIFAIAVAIFGAVVLFGRSFGLVTLSRDGLAMDTVIRITASARTSRDELEKTLSRALRLIEALDETFSLYDGRSRLSSVNANAGIRPVSVDTAFFSALGAAIEIAKSTNGAFDPTIGPLTTLWNIRDRGDKRLPTPEEIASALTHVGIRRIRMKHPDELFLTDRDTKIDLGGIAKGYASREVAKLLRSEGVVSALLDLGGNIMLLGPTPDGEPWRIGIQHPFKPRGTPLCAVVSSDTAVITAGTYERFATKGDRTFTHIFDPKTGYPVEGDLLSVTVITEDPVAGDALSTAFMVMGIDRTLAFLEKRHGVEAVFVSRAGDAKLDVLATGGLRGFLHSMEEGVEISFAEATR